MLFNCNQSLTGIFITNSVNPPFGIQSTQAKVVVYQPIFMSSRFLYFPLLAKRSSFIDVWTQTTSYIVIHKQKSMLGNAPAKDLKHKHTHTRPFFTYAACT